MPEFEIPVEENSDQVGPAHDSGSTPESNELERNATTGSSSQVEEYTPRRRTPRPSRPRYRSPRDFADGRQSKSSQRTQQRERSGREPKPRGKNRYTRKGKYSTSIWARLRSFFARLFRIKRKEDSKSSGTRTRDSRRRRYSRRGSGSEGYRRTNNQSRNRRGRSSNNRQGNRRPAGAQADNRRSESGNSDQGNRSSKRRRYRSDDREKGSPENRPDRRRNRRRSRQREAPKGETETG